MLNEAVVNARTAPSARTPARTDSREVKNLDFISVGRLIKTSSGYYTTVLQIGEVFKQIQFVVERLVEHLFRNLIMWISLQVFE